MLKEGGSVGGDRHTGRTHPRGGEGRNRSDAPLSEGMAGKVPEAGGEAGADSSSWENRQDGQA